jgi:hypothetical protein
MSLVVKREELITKFLLGDLPEEERTEVEIGLLADRDFFNDVLLIEGQLADSLLLGTLPEHQQRRLSSVPELRNQVGLTKLLKELSREQSDDSGDETWEKTLAEVEQNRQLLYSLIASDWHGLRTLMLLQALPQGIDQLQEELNIGEEQISELLDRLTRTGAIQEVAGIFSPTELGKKCLRTLESLT